MDTAPDSPPDTPRRASSWARHLTAPWWWLPAFLVGGQWVMSLTGYRDWAASVGQEAMLTLLFYGALLGPLAGLWALTVLRQLAADPTVLARREAEPPAP